MSRCKQKTMEGLCNCPVGTTEIEVQPLLPLFKFVRKTGIDVNAIENAARAFLGMKKGSGFPKCNGLDNIADDVIKITMEGVGVDKLDGLKQFTSLIELEAMGNKIGEIDGNALPASIEVLDVRANPVTSLKNLGSTPKLETLKLSSVSPLKEGADELAKLPYLDDLDMTGRPKIVDPRKMVGDMAVGNTSKHLKGSDVVLLKAALRGKGFTFNDYAENPPNLCDPNLHGNDAILLNNLGLKGVPACAASEDPEKLVLSNNSIENLDSLVGKPLPRLKKLYLDGNKVGSIDLVDAPNLEVLDLSGNQITVIDDLNYPKLKEINLSGNKLTSIGGTPENPVDTKVFSISKNIKRLNLSNNNISDKQGLVMITQLPNLDRLNLSGNPLTKVKCSAGWKTQVIPLREELDGSEIRKLKKCL